MKVNYTLPGTLPEPVIDSKNRSVEPFGAKLRLPVRESAPAHWRTLLRLDAPAARAEALPPPPAPHGFELRDGVAQRAWWRNLLDRHTPEEVGPGSRDARHPDAADAPVARMLVFLSETLRREEELFARHFAEAVE